MRLDAWVELAAQSGYGGARDATRLAKTGYGGVYATKDRVFKVVRSNTLAHAVSEMAVLGAVYDSHGVLGCTDVLCACEEGTHLVVYVMPRQKGDLASRLGELPSRDREVVRRASDLLVGVARLNEADLLHGDIKPGNVLVDRRNRLKLADYGISVPLRRGVRQSALLYSMWWRPPNVALAAADPKYDCDTYARPEYTLPLHQGDDVFAAALVIFELVYGRALVGACVPAKRHKETATVGCDNLWLLSFYATYVHAAPPPSDLEFWRAYDPHGRVPREVREKWSRRPAQRLLSFARRHFKAIVSERVEVFLMELVERCMSWNPAHRPRASDLVNRIAASYGLKRYKEMSFQIADADRSVAAVQAWWASFGSADLLANLRGNARHLVDAYNAEYGWREHAGGCEDVADGAVSLSLRAVALAHAGRGGGSAADCELVCAGFVEVVRACTMLAFARQRSWFDETSYRKLVYGKLHTRGVYVHCANVLSAVLRLLRGRLHHVPVALPQP